MNTRFILPGSLALTFHAFLLFGLTGKTPMPVVPADTKTPLPTDAIAVDQDNIDPEPRNQNEPESRKVRGPTAPRPPEIPIERPPNDGISIPTLPPTPGDPQLTTIPVDWQVPARSGNGDRDAAIDWIKLDRPPRARVQPAPVYPANLRSAGIEGTVTIEFLVDKEGNVCSPVVLRASHPDFIDPALRAVARWKFEPGQSAGRRVRFKMSVPLVFTLGDR